MKKFLCVALAMLSICTFLLLPNSKVKKLALDTLSHWEKSVSGIVLTENLSNDTDSLEKSASNIQPAENLPDQIDQIDQDAPSQTTKSDQKSDFIKWVDLNVSSEMLNKVYALDVKYHGTDVDFKFCEVLAYLATKNGNKFSSKIDNKNLNALLKILLNKESTVAEIFKDNKYFDYYLTCFNAIFNQFVGEYYVKDNPTAMYGLKVYFPLARGFWFNHYDDFGNSRSFGFKRKHLGHDLMGSTGTPIIAIEGGIVTELGWNRYGGWRVGIRSFDGLRYYYYAHLRKDKPYIDGLKLNDTVQAGQVVGYLGVTGYSTKQNVNMKTTKPHLHLGMQLIFHPSQEDGNGEIWIDMYQITKFLLQNTATVTFDKTTKEYKSTNLRYSLPHIQPTA